MYETAPQHGAIWARVLAEYLREQGFADSQIFRGSGLKPWMIEGERAAVPFDRIAALFENAAELTDDDLLGFHRGQEREMGRSGLIAYVGQSAPTLLTLLKNMARYARVFTDAVDVNVDELETKGVFAWQFRVSSTVQRRQHNEFSAVGLIHTIRETTHRRIQPLEVVFRHPRNRHLDAFRGFFGGEVTFGNDTNYMRFRISDLDTPLRTADKYLQETLIQCCEDALKQKDALRSSLILEVEKAVTEHLSAGEATQNAIAASLGMSRRTLSRRLSAEGTSFHRITEDLRKSLALSYLQHGTISQAEIAYLLGYADLSSYITAFKRWTGKTPGQYRKS